MQENTKEARQMAEIAKTEADKLAGVVVAEINSPEDMALATEQLTQLKTQAKNIKETRDKYILPMKKAVEDLDRDLFKPPMVKLAEMEVVLKRAMVAYQDRLDKAARAKQARIEKQVEAGKIDMATAVNKAAKIEQAPTQVHSSNGGQVRFNVLRKVRLKDFTQVPAWVFADPKVVAAMESVARSRALSEGVAGFEIYEEKVPAAYGGR